MAWFGLAESTNIGFNKAHKSCIRPARCIVEREREAGRADRDFCSLGVVPVVEPAGTIH